MLARDPATRRPSANRIVQRRSNLGEEKLEFHLRYFDCLIVVLLLKSAELLEKEKMAMDLMLYLLLLQSGCHFLSLRAASTTGFQAQKINQQEQEEDIQLRFLDRLESTNRFGW